MFLLLNIRSQKKKKEVNLLLMKEAIYIKFSSYQRNTRCQILNLRNRNIGNFLLISFLLPFKIYHNGKIHNSPYFKKNLYNYRINQHKTKLGQTSHKKHFRWLQGHQGWLVCPLIPGPWGSLSSHTSTAK